MDPVVRGGEREPVRTLLIIIGRARAVSPVPEATDKCA